MVGRAIAHPTPTTEPCCRCLQVTIPDATDHITSQGRALVRAVETLGTVRAERWSVGDGNEGEK